MLSCLVSEGGDRVSFKIVAFVVELLSVAFYLAAIANLVIFFNGTQVSCE